jgi:hypothetical protein
LTYLLDTNVLSEMRKPRPHEGVLAWIREIPDETLFLSAVTVGEIQAGIGITSRRSPCSGLRAVQCVVDQSLSGLKTLRGVHPVISAAICFC